MKFVMSYSCGKDSTLALHKMLAAGHEAVALLVMVREPDNNNEVQRSYFHGVSRELLAAYGEALGITVLACAAGGGEAYNREFEAGLRRAEEMGAEACCFGDIDLEEHRRWDEERCRAVGLTAEFPIWRRSREENVAECLRLGYKCLIKNVDASLLPESLLGRCLDEETIDILREAGVDVCGENGEYHTIVVDGPIFRRPLPVKIGEIGRGEYNRTFIGIDLIK